MNEKLIRTLCLYAALLATVALGALPATATLPIGNGVAVVTQYSNSAGVNPGQFVVQTFKVNGYPGTLTGVQTPWALSTRYSHPSWTVSTLGEVWGIDMDRYRNIYVAASSVYTDFYTAPGYQFGPGGPGGVYKINGVTGSVALLASLPNSVTPGGRTPSLGNLSVHPSLNLVYVTNFEDGIIYCLSTITGAIVDTHDPFSPDDGSVGMVERGERVWGIKAEPREVLFSSWVTDDSQAGPGLENLIWTIPIDANGHFSGSESYYARVPVVSVSGTLCCPPTNRVNPVSDIETCPWGGYLMAQRMYRGEGDWADPVEVFPYSATVFHYDYNTDPYLGWTEIGNNGTFRLSGGGVSGSYNAQFVVANPSVGYCDDHAWFSSIQYTTQLLGFQAVKKGEVSVSSHYAATYSNGFYPTTSQYDARHTGDIDVFNKFCRTAGTPVLRPRDYLNVRSMDGPAQGNLYAFELEALKSDVISHVVISIIDNGKDDGYEIAAAHAPEGFSCEASLDRAVFTAKPTWSFAAGGKTMVNESIKEFLVGFSSPKKSSVRIEIGIYVEGSDEPLRIQRSRLAVEPRNPVPECSDVNTVSLTPIVQTPSATTYQWCLTATNNNPLSAGPMPLLMEYLQVQSTTPGVTVSPIVQQFATPIGFGATSSPVCYTITVPNGLAGSAILLESYLLGSIEPGGVDHQGCCPADTMELYLPEVDDCCDSIGAIINHHNVTVTSNTATINATVNTLQPYRSIRVSVLSATSTRVCGNWPGTTDFTYAYFTHGSLAPFPGAVNAPPATSLFFGSLLAGAYTVGPAQFTLRLPAFTGRRRCTDTFRVCLRWEFTDVNCRTCDTITCFTFYRNYTNIQEGPPGGGWTNLKMTSPREPDPKHMPTAHIAPTFSITNVYPNPTNGSVALDFTSTEADVIHFQVVASDGSTYPLELEEQPIEEGRTEVSLNLSSIPAGSYMILAHGRRTSASTRVVVR